MKIVSVCLSVITIVVVSACSSSKNSVIPTSKTLPNSIDNYSIIWVGNGKAFNYVDGKYVRSNSNDYSFEVTQRRYGNTWKSVKNMHRNHPDYDGKAGAREQTMFFRIDFTKQKDKIISEVNSSLGNGSGNSDDEFREQKIQFSVDDISSFAPYNTIRITQHYKYEEGKLLETVELFKLKDSIEVPFVRIEEEAVIFRPVKLETAPTKFIE